MRLPVKSENPTDIDQAMLNYSTPKKYCTLLTTGL